jgi:geranylgeranyl reductase family protein
MHSCDVLIIGGGPAGSSCAWGLRSSGLDVLLLDKARFPRNKVCGGWITPQVLELLEIAPGEYALGRTLQRITGFRLGVMTQQEREIQYPGPVSYGIRRCEFDEYLLRRSGARVLEGTPVSSIERVDDGWIVNREISARLLVGAGGHFCPVSRMAGNRQHEEPVVAQEIEIEMTAEQAASCSVRPEIPELYFCRDLQGYGWCFRKDHFINIGLGRLDQHGLPEHVEEFLGFLRSSGKLKFALPGRPSGHAYLLFGNSRRKIVEDALLLIGDSAGLAYAQSGEGISPAIESGLLAAEVIQSARGCYSAARLGGYAHLLTQRFHSPNYVEKIARWLPSRLRNSLGRQLFKTDWFCRSTVLESWFLHWRDRADAN